MKMYYGTCVYVNIVAKDSGDEYHYLLCCPQFSHERTKYLDSKFWSFTIKLHSESQVSGRLGMSGGRSPRHAQNPLSGERRKTLSITHHALSPPPSHHHLYIMHLINLLQRFYRITMSLKRLFVPKSNVKQCFTTTTSKFWKKPISYTNGKNNDKCKSQKAMSFC